jgi:hypothetical protein
MPPGTTSDCSSEPLPRCSPPKQPEALGWYLRTQGSPDPGCPGHLGSGLLTFGFAMLMMCRAHRRPSGCGRGRGSAPQLRQVNSLSGDDARPRRFFKCDVAERGTSAVEGGSRLQRPGVRLRPAPQRAESHCRDER